MEQGLEVVLEEVLDEDTKFKARSEACDYFRSGLVENGFSGEQARHFVMYMHSEPFRDELMDKEGYSTTSLEAMLAVDEALP